MSDHHDDPEVSDRAPGVRERLRVRFRGTPKARRRRAFYWALGLGWLLSLVIPLGTYPLGIIYLGLAESVSFVGPVLGHLAACATLAYFIAVIAVPADRDEREE